MGEIILPLTKQEQKRKKKNQYIYKGSRATEATLAFVTRIIDLSGEGATPGDFGRRAAILSRFGKIANLTYCCSIEKKRLRLYSVRLYTSTHTASPSVGDLASAFTIHRVL